MILAGDIGATRTRLGFFRRTAGRPEPIAVREYATNRFAALTDVIRVCLDERSAPRENVDAACFGVAGPVLGDTASLTNVPFSIDAGAIASLFQIPAVALLNDLQAMACALPVLTSTEVHTLQEGAPAATGNMAVIAAGTGLGEAMLHRVGRRLVPSPTEAGHADWAPRTDRDLTVFAYLRERYGRAEVEHVLSGLGLPNLHHALHRGSCAAAVDPDADDGPAGMTRAALSHVCPSCVEALEVFVDAYGAEAGNLALHTMATGGVYVGGGIAGKIMPAMTDGRFIRAFVEKGAMRPLLERVPVHIMLNVDAGLLGAAVHASALNE
jgi:glucokinase